MRKSDQIREIVAELRRSLGPGVPAGDLLRLANLIQISYADVLAPTDEFGGGRESYTLDTTDVDVAFAKSWDVYEFERARASNIDNTDLLVQTELRARIERYLGPEWRQHNFRPSEYLAVVARGRPRRASPGSASDAPHGAGTLYGPTTDKGGLITEKEKSHMVFINTRMSLRKIVMESNINQTKTRNLTVDKSATTIDEDDTIIEKSRD